MAEHRMTHIHWFLVFPMITGGATGRVGIIFTRRVDGNMQFDHQGWIVGSNLLRDRSVTYKLFPVIAILSSFHPFVEQLTIIYISELAL